MATTLGAGEWNLFDSSTFNARSQLRSVARVIEPSMLQMLSSPQQPRPTNEF
jgi:hypothetical protein